MTTPLYQASEFVIPAEPQRRQVYAACASLAACGESWNPVTTAAVYWIPGFAGFARARNDEPVLVRLVLLHSHRLVRKHYARQPAIARRRFLPERGTHPCQPLRDSPRHLARMRERSKRGRMFVRLRLFECRELAQALVLTPGPLFNNNRVQLVIGANAARPRRRRD
jgi:hypothetical protein